MQRRHEDRRHSRRATRRATALMAAIALLAAVPAVASAASQTLDDPAGDAPTGPYGGADTRRATLSDASDVLTLSVDWVLAQWQPAGVDGLQPAAAKGVAWMDTTADAIADYALVFRITEPNTVGYDLHDLDGGSPGCQLVAGTPISSGISPMSGSAGALQSWSASFPRTSIGGARSLRWALMTYTDDPDRGIEDPMHWYDYVPDAVKGDSGPNPGSRACGGNEGLIADLAHGPLFPPPPPPPPPNQPPVASFAASPANPRGGEEVTLDGSASSDPDGSVAAYAWDLDNDGAYDDAIGSVVKRIYAAGFHEVGLQVTDDRGATATSRRTLRVGPACVNTTRWGGRASTSANLTGTPDCDTLIGTSENDFILGGAGDDFLFGNGGSDRMDGGSDDDVLLGEGTCPPEAGPYCVPGGTPGNDLLYGGSGNDILRGGGGRDRASGQSGDDRLRGDNGNDRLTGGSGRDLVSGGSGNDFLTGSDGDDRLQGSAGGDRLSGGSGRDILEGSSGSDRISARDNTRDRINCGKGRDRVIADRVDKVARNCEQVTHPRSRR